MEILVKIIKAILNGIFSILAGDDRNKHIRLSLIFLCIALGSALAVLLWQDYERFSTWRVTKGTSNMIASAIANASK